MRAKGSPLIGLFMLVLVTGARAQQTAGAALLETRSKGSLNPDAPWSNSQEKEPENVMNLTPLMTNPVNTHPYHRPGRVVFPMVFDSKLNPFLNNSPYNPIPGTTLVQVPAPVSDGHPSEGIGVFPPGFLEIEASSSSSRSPYHSHYSHNHNHNRYHSAPSHAPAPRFSQDRAGTAVEQRLRQKAVVKATLKAMVKDGAPATWALPTAPFADPFTKEEDPILNFNPYNPYTRVGHWTRRNVPPGQARSFTGPVLAVPPGDPTVMGVPVGMGGG